VKENYGDLFLTDSTFAWQHKEVLIRVDGLWIKIQNWDVMNMKQKF